MTRAEYPLPFPASFWVSLKGYGGNMALIDLTGQRFGRLVVLQRAESKVYNGKAKQQYYCQCDCGRQKVILAASLLNGRTASCGCIRKEQLSKLNKVHGCSGTRLYDVWCNMKARCYNEDADNYKHYGGRGIAVCDEWKQSFESFQEWALSNGYDEKLSIDRIDVNGDYEPSNCRWITAREQSYNRRTNRMITFKGQTRAMKEWSEITGIPLQTIAGRIRRGWTIEETLTKTP